MRLRIKIPPFLIAVLIVLSGVFAYFSHNPLLNQLELKTIDMRFRVRGEIETDSRVALAVIDERSIDSEGKWIWPRSRIAALIEKLSAAGAEVIAFDIGFIDPDDNGPVMTLRNVRNKLQTLSISEVSLDSYLDELTRAADNDGILAEAIRQSRSKVVLGYFFQMDGESGAHTSPDQVRVQAEAVDSSRYSLVRYASATAADFPFVQAHLPESNIPRIAAATPYSGYFNMFPDEDGVIRWIPGVIAYGNSLYAHLSIKTIEAYLEAPLSLYVADYGATHFQVGDLAVPTDEMGRIMINYRGGSNTFDHISVTDILNDRVDPARIRDKIIVVGVTAVGIYDLRVTPFENVYPGVEIHANLIDSILAGDFLHQPAWAAVFDIFAIVCAGMLIGIAIPRLRVTLGAIITILLLSGYILLCQYLFSRMGLVLNLVYPVLVIFVAYIALSLYRYLVQEGQKRFIKNAFSTYLSPAVVNQLIDSPEKLVLGGQKREITAFFSDVEGFTTISEKLTPEALVELLNEFLTEMTDIVLDNAGMVDKFEGDAIIAMFGAPNDLKEHARAACFACIRMQKRLEELRPVWKEAKGVTIRMRIGLCTGQAVVGNMGSKSRMDYTMMGDTVNTAARLEGVNKFYGTYVMIGESTYEAASDAVFAREIDSINVVGKSLPVKIYQLIGLPEEVDDAVRRLVETYEKGLGAYRKQEWDNAIDLFEQALVINPDDTPSRVMSGRCQEFKETPPGPDWNGAFSMRSK